MLAFLLATTVLAKPPPACAVTKEFVGTAPSDIIQQKFEAHFQLPLNRVDCRDNGLCYQTWGKDCPQATQ